MQASEVMIFSANTFIITLLSFAIFLFVAPRFRWALLLLSSIAILWAASVPGAILLITQTLLAYGMALLLARFRRPDVLWSCLAVILTPLFMMKLGKLEETPFLPLGLSFYTFQLLAYLIEVYWQRRAPEKHVGRFLAFNILFMNKTAGPIERPSLLDQLPIIYAPDRENFIRSVFTIWLGLFQKFAIADNLAQYVNGTFEHAEAFRGLPVLVSILLSKYQIFADFSGVSLIAIGLAGLFGLKFSPNFRRPFAARTMRDFWRRWHISLQSWIRDYVFFPLLSTPLARLGVWPILAFTFILFGLWHGFTWNFVAYGFLQSILIVAIPEKWAQTKKALVPVVLIFNYVVLISLPSILFRTPDFHAAWSVLSNCGLSLQGWNDFTILSKVPLRWLMGLIALNELWQWAEERYAVYRFMSRVVWPIQVLVFIALIYVFLYFGNFEDSKPFIYSLF